VGEFATVCTYTPRNLVATRTEQFTPATGSTLPATATTVTFTYTPTGKKASASDPRNAAWLTSYAYGTCCDRLVSVTDAQGFITQYSYDNLGRVTAVTDPNGNVTTTRYDAQGRVIARTDGAGATTTVTYDDNLTDGVGLDAAYAVRVADLGFGPGAAGSAVLTTTPVGGTICEIHDGLGRTVRRVVGGKQ
jgi:YD repeat-containing protein